MPDGIPSLPQEGAAKPLGVVEGFKKFLLWLGGSLAGITAVLYGCGYLVTRAHLSMLGLYGLVEYGNDHFLQEGAKFLVSVGYDVLRTFLPLAALLALLAGLGALAYLGGARALRGSRLAERVAEVRGRLAAFGWWRQTAFAALFVALIWHSDRYLDAFEQPLGVLNLLYAEPVKPAPMVTGTAKLKTWLLSGEVEKLGKEFDNLLLGLLMAGALAVAAWRVSAPWRSRVWLTAPFLAAATIYLITLPMDYGALLRPVRYPVVTFDGNVQPGTGPFFLFAHTGEGFVVWDSAARRVVWMPPDGVRRAEIGEVGMLFGSRREGDKGGAK